MLCINPNTLSSSSLRYTVFIMIKVLDRFIVQTYLTHILEVKYYQHLMSVRDPNTPILTSKKYNMIQK